MHDAMLANSTVGVVWSKCIAEVSLTELQDLSVFRKEANAGGAQEGEEEKRVGWCDWSSPVWRPPQ